MNWRSIDGFPGYEVSVRGWVRNARGEVLRARPNVDGYMRVVLTVNGRRHYRRVHLLVLETFVGPRPSPRHHGAHAPDRSKTNNALSNLRWALPEENERDKRAHGTHPRGGRVWRPNKERIARIRDRHAAGESMREIARAEGLHRSSVSRIVRGLRRNVA